MQLEFEVKFGLHQILWLSKIKKYPFSVVNKKKFPFWELFFTIIIIIRWNAEDKNVYYTVLTDDYMSLVRSVIGY